MKSATISEFKFMAEAGTFEGRASVYNNTDLDGDIIAPGAFKEIVTTKDGHVRVLNQHRMAEPIGKAKVTDQPDGLHFSGQLLLSDPAARRVHELMKADIVDGMSIGFDILPNGSEWDKDGTVRTIKAAKLWEISVVTFGANPEARITGVKQITTIREFEDFLRDAGGFSAAQAKRLASGGYKALQGARDAGTEANAITELNRLIDGFQFPSIHL